MRITIVMLMIIPLASVTSVPSRGEPDTTREAEVAKALEDPDAVATGKKLFVRCMVCHTVGEDAKPKLGPALNGVVGRKAAAVDGFKRYSPGMRKAAADGLVWTVEKLDAYIKQPKEVVPAGTMAFPGIPVADQRKAIIAYLASFNEDGSRVSQ